MEIRKYRAFETIPQTPDKFNWLPGPETVMTGNHIMEEAGQYTPASGTASAALPIKTATDNFFGFCCCQFSHNKNSFFLKIKTDRIIALE